MSHSFITGFWPATKGDQPQGCRSWGWGVLTPWKYIGAVRVCFDPPKMSHSFIQSCCWTTLQFSHHQGWKTSEIEGFSRYLKQFWWLDLTDSDPNISRQIYATDQPAFCADQPQPWCIKLLSENKFTWFVLTNHNPISRFNLPLFTWITVGNTTVLERPL